MHTVVTAALVGFLLLGAPAAEPGAGTPTADTVSARSLLAQIPVKPEHDSGYERAKFGGFIDADHDGCDTRGEVLLAEATRKPKVTAGCRLVGGRWVSRYDATVHTSATGLQIDHLVALSEAWKSGAYRWTAGTRRRYANDLGYSKSLIAVTAGVNMSKGDRGPGQWTPPARSYRCTYVAEYIAVKWRWRLSIDSFERASLRGLLNYCDKNGGARTVTPKRATVTLSK